MLRLVKLEGRWGFAWGYQNEEGHLVVPPYFPEAREFSEGMAAVKFISSWGYIDEQGKVAISPMFDDADSFAEGVARVKVGSKYGFIARTGKFTIVPQFIWVSNFVNGLAKIKNHIYNTDICRDSDTLISKNGQKFNRFFDLTPESTDDSVVFHQQTSYQVVFSVDQITASEISYWSKGNFLSSNQINSLKLESNKPRYYCFNFSFVADKTHLEIIRTNPSEQIEIPQFSKNLNSKSSKDLLYLESIINLPENANEQPQLVLKVEGYFYQYLLKWNHWAGTEAFTGRYRYNFCVSCNEQNLWAVTSVRIIDSKTGTTCSSDWEDEIEITFP